MTGSLREAGHALEAGVDNGLATFIDVGEALAEIRDTGLYRYGYDTFEDYAEHRFGLSRSRAYQAIDYAKVSTMVDKINSDPEHPDAPFRAIAVNERAARELVPLMGDPDTFRTVWDRAVEIAAGHSPTNQQVRRARREIENPAIPRTGIERQARTVLDGFGDILDQVKRQARRVVEANIDDDTWQACLDDIDQIKAALDARKGLRS